MIGEIGREGCEISSLVEHTIRDGRPGCFYNIVAFPVTPAALILSNS